MELLGIIVILVGLSLDVYAVVVCYGAMLLKIEKSKLLKMCSIFSLWQGCALMIGYLITQIPVIENALEGVGELWTVFSLLIFAGMGVYMLLKAWRDVPIYEHLMEIRYKQVCIAACFTSIDAIFAGMGFSFLHSSILLVVLTLIIITIIVVSIGLFTGYRLGSEQKVKAYIAGGVLLLAGTVGILMRYLFN